MDVHSAEHVAHGKHLQIVHDTAIAFFGRVFLFRPNGKWMCPGSDNGQAMIGRMTRKRRAKPAQIVSRFLGRAAGWSTNLDLGLQQLVGYSFAELFLTGAEELLRHRAAYIGRPHVGDEVLFFDADAIRPHVTAPSRALSLASL